jgi:hypothetical protein
MRGDPPGQTGQARFRKRITGPRRNLAERLIELIRHCTSMPVDLHANRDISGIEQQLLSVRWHSIEVEGRILANTVSDEIAELSSARFARFI